MGIIAKLLGGGVSEPIDAIGNVFDKLFTSDEERATSDAVLLRIKQHPHLVQAEINKIEAGHRSVFVAGWRPAIGWACAVGLAFAYVINPIIQWITGEPGPDLPMESIDAMVTALLGLGALRTFEKATGRTK